MKNKNKTKKIKITHPRIKLIVEELKDREGRCMGKALQMLHEADISEARAEAYASAANLLEGMTGVYSRD